MVKASIQKSVKSLDHRMLTKEKSIYTKAVIWEWSDMLISIHLKCCCKQEVKLGHENV